MGRFYVKFGENEYAEWSTVVDAPLSWMVSRGRLIAALVSEDSPSNPWESRLERLDAYNTTERGCRSLEDSIGFNRAGPNGECLTIEGLRRMLNSFNDDWRPDPDEIVDYEP